MKKLVSYLKDNEINLLASILFPFTVGFIIFVNHFAWSYPITNESTLNKVQEFFFLLWIIPLPVAVLSFLGIFLYKKGEHLKTMEIPPLYGNKLYFRLVTRGINQNTVAKTVKNVIQTMETLNNENYLKIQYVLEVVTEKTNPSLKDNEELSSWVDRTTFIELPIEYSTSRGARFKARALHYSLEKSTAQENDWIFHLDDESQIDRLTVLGILEFIAKEEGKIANQLNYKPLIGQGTILYYRNLRQSLFYTLADSLRTADDMGRYFLQYLFGVCVFGMHGSFILVRNSVENDGGFDFYPNHCITEDAYWALKMMQKGYRFGHVYGYVHEQSPNNALDFIKQRRRWFIGIYHVLQADDIAFKYKLILFLMSFLWALSGPIIIFTAFNIIHPVAVPETIGILASFAYAIYIIMYITGFYINIKHSQIPLYRKIYYFFLQILFIPVFSFLEASGAVYGIFDRKIDFHVISK